MYRFLFGEDAPEKDFFRLANRARNAFEHVQEDPLVLVVLDLR